MPFHTTSKCFWEKKIITGASSVSGQIVKQVNVFKGSSRRVGLLATGATKLRLAAMVAPAPPW